MLCRGATMFLIFSDGKNKALTIAISLDPGKRILSLNK